MYLLRRAATTHNKFMNTRVENSGLSVNIQVNFKHKLANDYDQDREEYQKFLKSINKDDNHNKFSKKYGIKFSDDEIMHQVCTHKSFKLVDLPTNERLRFLGKKVIQLYSTEYFLKNHEGLPPNKLKNRINEFIDEEDDKLGIIGMKMGLNKLMYWTPVNNKALEESKSQGSYLAPSGEIKVVGKALLAFVGAIYHDKGALTARKFVFKNILLVNEEE